MWRSKPCPNEFGSMNGCLYRVESKEPSEPLDTTCDGVQIFRSSTGQQQYFHKALGLDQVIRLPSTEPPKDKPICLKIDSATKSST